MRWFIAGAIVVMHAVPQVHASPEWDRKYRLSTVSVLKPADNVDGLFSQTLQNAAIQALEPHRRFKVVDAQSADPVLGSARIAYEKLIDDAEVLRVVAARIGAETLIRIKAVKKDRDLSIKLDWLHAPRIQLLASENWVVTLPAPGEPLGGPGFQRSFDEHIARLLNQVPSKGLVTGRDHQTLTVGMGRGDSLRPGDLLTFGTLDKVDVHPLYQALENWVYSTSGRARVTEVAQDLAFAEVIEETPGIPIERDHAVTRVDAEAKRVEAVKVEKVPDAATGVFANGLGSFLGGRPKLGWVAVELSMGSLSRQYSSAGDLTGTQGGGLLLGGRFESQIWMTREIFLEAGLGYGFTTYSQKLIETGLATAAGGVSASLMQWHADVGYQLFLTPNFWGPRLFARVGYRSTAFGMPISVAESTGPFSVGSIFLGVGFELPVRDGWGVLASADLGIFRSAIFTGWEPGTVTGAGDLSLSVGPYLRLGPNVTLRAPLYLDSFGASFADLAAVSALSFRIAPTLQVFF